MGRESRNSHSITFRLNPLAILAGYGAMMRKINIMNELHKVVRLGSVPYGHHSRMMGVFCKIEIKDGRLSISGVEGPRRNGDCYGSCGQIDMHLRDQQAEIVLAPSWDRAMLTKFFEVWERWHLNDMRAGSPEQEQWLRNNPIPKEEYAYPKSHYEVASGKLAAAGLNPDKDGYKYGHAWKSEELPYEVVEFLSNLPETDQTPAWV